VPSVLIDLMVEYVYEERILLDTETHLYSLPTHHILKVVNKENDDDKEMVTRNSEKKVKSDDDDENSEWKTYDVPSDHTGQEPISDGMSSYIIGINMRMFSTPKIRLYSLQYRLTPVLYVYVHSLMCW
jgi:hypothetical protein